MKQSFPQITLAPRPPQRDDFTTAVIVFACLTLVLWVAALARFWTVERRVRLLEDRPVCGVGP
jgi:hypothetical protein